MKIDFLGGKADPLILKGKQIGLFLVLKWYLACGRQIRVLGTQLLDPVVEQGAQISYRIFTTNFMSQCIAQIYYLSEH